MSKNKQLSERLQTINSLSAQVIRACVDPQFANGSYISDDSQRLASLAAAAASSPIFESFGDQAPAIASAWGSALREYAEIHDCLPSNELLASAAQALSNISFAGEGQGGNIAMLESVKASLNTTEGIEIRAKQAGLILPVLLMAATSDAVTYIPAQANETEIFEIRRVAGSTLGDYNQGDEIGLFSHGQYASMNQQYPFIAAQQPDGAKKVFTFNSATDLNSKKKLPFKRGSVKLMVNRRIVATEVEGQAGKLFGTATIGGTEVVFNGTINAAIGQVEVTTSVALAAGTSLIIDFDIDVEKGGEEVIPTITHDMGSWKLRPHESVIAAEHTIQAFWLMNREFSLDIRSTQMNHLRNYLAYEKDIKNLRKMLLAATDRQTFDLAIPDGLTFREHYETINTTLQILSQAMLARTQVSGLVGMFCGTQATAIFKSLGAPLFQTVDGYRQVPRIHYVGKLFGMFKVFEVPKPIEAIKGMADTRLGEWDCLCYARGENHTEAGLVCGDAVPATMYDHSTSKALVDRSTLWELSYCDIHPNDGGRYYSVLTLVPPAPKVGG